jgi:23S rRNA (cytidine1920-2'-O)/16S rRNA (cytidine1409-2'-O)-methyltransferase
MEYVSRAGVKLEHALQVFKIDPKGKTCLDSGAATGGFTDCLLQHGAAKVYAVETGYGTLAWKLRNNPQVVVLERTNILYEVPIGEKVDLITLDTSWTRLKLSVPAAAKYLDSKGTILALLKPQYEVNKKDLVKGIVKEEVLHETVESVRQELQNQGFVVSEAIDSPIKGDGGNREFWLMIQPKVAENSI